MDKESDRTRQLDETVVNARRSADERARGYRERALAMYPWVCGRCGREFDRSNVRELTVHHRNHDHDHNPPDGSNWELLCLYCHDNEHARLADHEHGELGSGDAGEAATSRPFADLADRLRKR